jgi:hypothetical protein
MLIVAGSTSPEEIEATKQAFSNYYTDFQIEAVSIERGVYEVLRDGVGRPEQVFEPLAEMAERGLLWKRVQLQLEGWGSRGSSSRHPNPSGAKR